jgi:sulfur-oxidizing protein SoxZ
MANIKLRATAKGDEVTVKALMQHPMTPATEDKTTGKKIPPHFIKEVTCEHNGNVVMTANWSVGVSKNPYLSFKFTGGAKGDTVKISWVDNEGASESGDTKVR